jgi:hypothetical protein
MEMTNSFSMEELQTADVQGQQEAQTMAMPEEKYAGLGSWAARKIIKGAKPKPADDVISSDLIYKKYNIKPEEKPAVEKKPEVVTPQTTNDLRPLDGDTGTLPEIEVPYSFNTEREALGLAESDISQFDTTDSFQMNFSTLETPDDVSGVIGAMAEANKGKIDEARRGTFKEEQLRGLAADLGRDPEFIRSVLERKTGELFPAEKMLAVRQVLEQSATALKRLSKQLVIDGKEAKDTDKVAFQKQFLFHQEFQTQFMGARAEMGRSMWATGVPTGTEQANMEKTMEMLTAMERGVDIETAAASINAAEDARGINGIVDTMSRSKTNVAFDSIYEVYINSILSGFKTHIVNLAGSKLRLWADVVDTKVASWMSAGDVSPMDKVNTDEWKAAIFAQNIVSLESIKIAMQTMKTAAPYQGISKQETAMRKSLDKNVYAQTFGLDPDGMLANVIHWMGEVVRAPTERLMAGTDALMRHQAERVHIVKAAYREAQYLAEKNSLDEAQSLALLNDLIENPTAKIRAEASDFASDVTFQTPLGKMGRGFQKQVANIPGARYIFPFVKTPANLLKQGFLERTPLGFLSEKIRSDIMGGGVKAQMAKSKIATGTALGYMAYMAASNGSITGSEPQDRDVSLARREAGWRPRSVVFESADGTKEYVSYDRMEPFSYLIGAVADFHEYMESTKYTTLGEEDEDRADRMASALVISFAENTLNKTFMTGMRDLMNVWTDPKRYGAGWFSRTVNAFIPYSGLRRDVTRLNDDTKRLNKDTAEYIQANSIFWASSLPPRRDNFGNEVKYDTVLNPWSTSTEESDFVYFEIGRLAQTTKRAPIPKGSNRLGGVEMSPKEYDAFVLLSRKELQIGGKNFRDKITEVISLDGYDKLMDDDKVDMLKSIAQKYDTAARKIIANEDPTVMEKLQRRSFVKAAKRNAKQNGTTEEAEFESLKQIYGGK